MTASPISNFSSLLEIAFGMNAVSGVIQVRVKDDYALLRQHLSSAASEYCDESEGESTSVRDLLTKVSRRFSKRLEGASQACSALVIAFCIISLFLLLLSSLNPSCSIGNMATATIVSLLITGPILILAIFIVLSKANAINAINQVQRICFELESSCLHPSGVISMKRIGERVGISMPSHDKGVLDRLAAWLAGVRTIKVNMSEIEPEVANLLKTEGKEFTEENAYEGVSKAMGFLFLLYEKEKRSPGSMLRFSGNGKDIDIPISKIIDGIAHGKDPAEILSLDNPESDESTRI
ncbi:hypothetical protein KBY84_02640 [Cyanobium sp. N.Huapi 1H5]|uniref:hypothetical protein n=1 Tax=Cyanobium sp. N.Huapi 1H5 TaxID=2823719 RepID=UPI0020CF90CC|nr:hypothetical protein [Cyanobium sp. N.Huapi 1H5]MCP9836391.1 hypothetical protein [Cyanobium sp. N.Huapi 1H5]